MFAGAQKGLNSEYDENERELELIDGRYNVNGFKGKDFSQLQDKRRGIKVYQL
jgi:hypothetical protein